MTHPLDASGIVELAVLSRSGLDESRHLGAAAVVAPDGSLLAAHGDVDALVYGRSSLKFFQAITVLRSGVSLEGAQLVLASASHAGTPAHVAVVRQLLDRAGLAEDDLQCPIDWPTDSASRSAAQHPSRVYMNCSGKHAAFLLACVDNGWSTHDYLDQEHPLQQRIRATVEEFTAESVGHVGIDGCGAPVFAVTLRGLATAVGRVSRDPDGARLAAAILAEPWALDGHGRQNTVVMEQLGLLAKGGAEGVIVMATPEGTAVALKMIDGSPRATTLVALQLLASVGAISQAEADRVADLTTERVLGGGARVGDIRATFPR
ncbi:asparaginase [Lacisediminihabitans changchengi]|uniref:Asparaginase n=1 Tax=Lacisediminihabitans changchengi TaxID=2787634 RepID=A0A934W3R9_9MICO|nr:asparaginase [Lacisediminihabitans changchengi]MBK4347524.1 asparaginase [Lacisediminihabitans changchengi]